jgi:Flp pilus assembly pilin Flp
MRPMDAYHASGGHMARPIHIIHHRAVIVEGAFIMRYHCRHQEGQGLVEYGLVLILVAILLIVLVGILGKAPRQTLADVYCIVKYKSSDPMRAVDLTQPGGSPVNTALGSHTLGSSPIWIDFKNQYGWLSSEGFVCLQGQLGTNGTVSSYTIFAGS